MPKFKFTLEVNQRSHQEHIIEAVDRSAAEDIAVFQEPRPVDLLADSETFSHCLIDSLEEIKDA